MSSKAKATPINQPRKRELSPRPHEGLKPVQAKLAYLISDMLLNCAHAEDLELVGRGAFSHYFRTRFSTTDRDPKELGQSLWEEHRNGLATEWTGQAVRLHDLEVEATAVPLTSAAVFRSNLRFGLANRMKSARGALLDRPEESWILSEILGDYEAENDLMDAISFTTEIAGYVPVKNQDHIEAVKAFVKILEGLDKEAE
jgi:hypothetical protein